MRIFARLNGEQYTLELKPQNTILDAKIAIQKESGISPEQQCLIYAGKQLNHDGHALNHHAILRDSTIHIVLRLRGESSERTSSKTVGSALSRLAEVKKHSATIAKSQNHESLPQPALTLPTKIDNNFDEDDYIVNPRAYFKKLKDLERETVEGSIFYQYKGKYDTFERHAFRGQDSKFIRNIPESLRYLDNLGLTPDLTVSTSSVDIGPEKRFDRLEPSERRAYLCQIYIMICSVIQRFESMRESKFSTSFFSILRLHGTVDVAEIVQLRASHVESIKVGLEAAIEQTVADPGSRIDDNPKSSFQELLQRNIETPCMILLDAAGITPPEPRSRNSQSVLNLSRMTAIFLDLALVSYAGSHGSPFCAKFLCQDSQEVEMRGETADDFSFRCSMRPLACLHGFLDRREAWVFQFGPGQQLPARLRASAKLLILAKMNDFADLWGPVWTIRADAGYIKQYNVSKGVICRVGGRHSGLNAVKCHWYSRASYTRRRVSSIISRGEDLALANDDLLLIGTEFRQNRDCRFTIDDYDAEYGKDMGVLGTTPCYWKTDTRGLSLGLSKIVGVTVSGSQKLIPQTSIKQHILDKWTNSPARANPGILNQYLGVEISNCTGNARRISLRTLLLLKTVFPLLERQIPAWRRTIWGSRFETALSITNPKAIFDVWQDFPQYRDQMAQLVCCVLEVLNSTGRANDNFLAGFLHNGQESSVSLDYGRNDWAEILEDSHLTGVYAVVNEICLECRLPDHSAMTCTNTDAYTVLLTQFEVDTKDNSLDYDSISVSPHRKIFQRADAGTDRIALFKPKSRSMFTLSRFSALKASELRDQSRSEAVFYLRAASRSHHGRKLPRRRLVAPAPRHITEPVAKKESRVISAQGSRHEQRPIPPPEQVPPAVARNYGDRNWRAHRRDTHRRLPRDQGEDQTTEDYDTLKSANHILDHMRNYVIEDYVDDTAENGSDRHHPYERHHHINRPQVDDAVLKDRDYS